MDGDGKYHIDTDADPTRSLLGMWLTQETIEAELLPRVRLAVFPVQYQRSAEGILGCFRERGHCDVVSVADYMKEKMEAGVGDVDQLMMLGVAAPVGGHGDRLYAMVEKNSGTALPDLGDESQGVRVFI